MNIAIIGAGNIGELLGRRWRPNHNVILGVRDPESEKSKALAGKSFNIGNVQNSVDKSELVVLAVPASAVESVVKGTHGLETKIIIDVTNPISTRPRWISIDGGSSGGMVRFLTGSEDA